MAIGTPAGGGRGTLGQTTLSVMRACGNMPVITVMAHGGWIGPAGRPAVNVQACRSTTMRAAGIGIVSM